MTDPKPAEPSMEEILASIRQIINQNEPAADESTPALAVDNDEASPSMDADTIDNAPEDDDILELTAILEDEPLVTQEDIMPATTDETYSAASAAPEIEPEIASAPAAKSDTLITGMTAAAATAALNNLASTLQQERAGHSLPVGNSARTLESMVVESMKPLLKDWLDANLPQLVERVVQQEVEKLTRRLGA